MNALHIPHHHHLHNHLPLFFYSVAPPPYRPPKSLLRHPNSSIRPPTLIKSTSNENPSSPIETSDRESDNPASSSSRVEVTESGSGLFSSISLSLSSFGEVVKLDELGWEIVSIALPAALALAADPITSLVDTAFVGHLGSVELAAVGVSASVFNLVSKLFNVPLLNITTSFVAEEQTILSKSNDESIHIDQNGRGDPQEKKFLPSVSTSLALAASIGVAEALALSVGSGFLINTMGIPFDSPMHIPAEQFITLRAFGAPPIVIALAAQGTFRGFKDTKTPLYAVGAGNLLNVILDIVFIFAISLGIDGAALATVISEYVIAFILLWKLNDKVLLIPPSLEGTKVVQYLKSGGFLIGRTLAVLVTVTLATSMAAREGPIQMAGYQICLEIWLALSLLNDALALAGQALLASSYSEGNYDGARQVINRVLKLGLIAGVALTTILFFGFGAISSLFSNDTEVLETARSGTLFVAGSQVMNALAFVLDGLYYGVSDFEYAAYSMILIGTVSSLFILAAAPVFGLAGIWTGLYLFMTLRVVGGIWRLSTRKGPWKLIWSEKNN